MRDARRRPRAHYREIDIGKHAASRTLGKLRTGVHDLQAAPVRENLIWTLTQSLIAATAFHRIVDEFKPDKLITSVQNLTRGPEFYNGAALRGLDLLFYYSSHHEGAFLFRRYRTRIGTRVLSP